MFDSVILWLSFLAGIGMFFNPCSVALLPAFVGLTIRRQGQEGRSALARAAVGLRVGVTASLGILVVFLLAGLLISAAGNVLAPYALWYGSVTGTALVILGAFLLLGKSVRVPLPHRSSSLRLSESNDLPVQNSYFGFFAFGIAYAVGSIACTLPAFLLVVFAALGGGASAGFVNFLAFSAGVILLLLTVSLASAVSQVLVARWIAAHIGLLRKLTALVVMAAGSYLIFFNLRAFVF